MLLDTSRLQTSPLQLHDTLHGQHSAPRNDLAEQPVRDKRISKPPSADEKRLLGDYEYCLLAVVIYGELSDHEQNSGGRCITSHAIRDKGRT